MRGNSKLDDGKEIRRLESHINSMLVDEEIYWKQRSRADWLREGDKNTKYFHAKASARKRKNKVWGIENDQGIWLKERDEIDEEICSHFQELFTTSNPSPSQIQATLQGMTTKVTPEMNVQLETSFTAEDVEEALANLCPTKAPGPDGLPAAFF